MSGYIKKDYETFLKELEASTLAEEWFFYFDDDPLEIVHTVSCFRMAIKPFHLDTHESHNAKALLEAKYFKGQSFRDRWEHVIFVPEP